MFGAQCSAIRDVVVMPKATFAGCANRVDQRRKWRQTFLERRASCFGLVAAFPLSLRSPMHFMPIDEDLCRDRMGFDSRLISFAWHATILS
jgi:hypothetical protein